MKFDKKVRESGAVAAFAIMMAVSTMFSGGVATQAVPVSQEKEFTGNSTNEEEVATIERKQVDVVGSAEDGTDTEAQDAFAADLTVQEAAAVQPEVQEQTTAGTQVTMPAQMVNQEVSPWASKLMANVEDYLNIRTEASEEAEVAGKLRKGDLAAVVERGEVWTKISSGNVVGYVKNELCVTGFAAEALANELGQTLATAVSGGIRIRAAASADENTQIIDVMAEGAKLEVAKDAPAAEGWVAVKTNDQVGYVSAQYVSVELELGKAISIEEERAAIAAAEAEKARKAAEEAKKAQRASAGTQQKEAVAASYDDVTLLGALIQCEAGSECYEGKLAVGAVVMNRLRAGYSSSISGVIYQRGQFTPASTGKLEGVLARGVSGSCLQAAQDAINGADNVSGAKNFKRASSGQAGIVIGNHVFY